MKKILLISEGINYNKITLIGNHAFNGCSKITSLILNDSITKIGDYAFKNCLNIANQINIPASNISEDKINMIAVSNQMMREYDIRSV